MDSELVPWVADLSGAGSEARSIKLKADSERQRISLPDPLHSLLATASAEHGLQKPLILLTVFLEVLRRYTGQKSVAVSFDEAGSASRIIRLEGDSSLRELVEQYQDQTGDVPNSELLNVALDGQFSFQDTGAFPDHVQHPANRPGIRCSMQCSVEALSGFIEAEAKIGNPGTMPYFVSSYQALLGAALADLNSPIGKLDMLNAADRETFDRWNATELYYPHARVDELFELRAKESPEATAVTFLNTSMSYGALSDATKQLASRLRNLGVQPGTLVGICMDRSIEMVVALLATFRAGAAYLPLDPAFPRERIDFMQQDARPLVMLTQSHLREKCSATAHLVCLDVEEVSQGEADLPAESLPPRASSLDDIAYVIYTSGSTGKPKGVQITQRALTNMLYAALDHLGLNDSDVFLATATISFDMSVFEIFAPLVAGAHLVVAPREIAVNGELLGKAISDSGATLLQATPAGWQLLLEAGWAGYPGLKMLAAGEPLSWMLAQRLLDRGASLWNLYGPTETTVYATGRRISKEDVRITVGRPMANYTTYVVDEHHHLLPIGAIGELLLGGIGVGVGYLNRPELTAERFIPDLFSGQPEARLYCTGDRARMLPNGEIDLLGRSDNQIKLRGYRIELEEIEASLDSHPGIRKSVARVITTADGDQCLVAYVIPRDMHLVDEAGWRQHALRILPSYMAPAAFVVMESFLLTPSGKVDRKALPAFQPSAPLGSEEGNESAEHTAERIVLHCWRKVLGRPDLGLDQNFFDAGGHSLLIMRMLAQMNSTLGRKLPTSLLLEAPTARRFAELAVQTKDGPAKHLVPMQPEGSLPPLYLVHHLLGDVLIYRDLANQFRPNRPVYGIQAAADLAHRSKPCSVEDLASDYVGEIIKQQTASPIHLAGFSTGSILAFEMARQLTKRGVPVGLLALIDGDVQAEGVLLPKRVKYTKMAVRKICKIVFKMRDEVADGPRQFIMKRWRHVCLNRSIRALENSTFQGQISTEQALLLAERSYRGGPYSGSALLIRFHDEAWKFGPNPLMGWSGLVQGGLEVIDLDGGHITGMGLLRAPAMAKLLSGHIEAREAAYLAQ